MPKHESGDSNQTRPALGRRLKLLGGAAAASLAVLIPGCGIGNEKPDSQLSHEAAGGRKYDPRTEAALGRAIRPALVDSARQIIDFSKNHPELTLKVVGKRSVELLVTGENSYKLRGSGNHQEGAGLSVVTLRHKGSRVPDPDTAVSANAYYGLEVEGRPDQEQTFHQSFDLYAPRASSYLSDGGSGPTHPLGWEANEWLGFGSPHGDNENNYFYESSSPQFFPGYGTPLATARTVVLDVPNILDSIESELTFMHPID
jgi:hypothetical protein